MKKKGFPKNSPSHPLQLRLNIAPVAQPAWWARGARLAARRRWAAGRETAWGAPRSWVGGDGAPEIPLPRTWAAVLLGSREDGRPGRGIAVPVRSRCLWSDGCLGMGSGSLWDRGCLGVGSRCRWCRGAQGMGLVSLALRCPWDHGAQDTRPWRWTWRHPAHSVVTTHRCLPPREPPSPAPLAGGGGRRHICEELVLRRSPSLLWFWGKNPLEQDTGREEGAGDGHHPLGAHAELGAGWMHTGC